MFVTPELAARIDRAEARLCAWLAEATAAGDPETRAFTVPVAGGLAIFAGSGSPINKMIGIGFGAAPEAGELAPIEARFAALGAKLQAEVSILAAPETHALLIGRGYQPRGFENQLGHALRRFETVLAPGVDVARLPEGGAEWCDLSVEAFASPDVGGVGGDELPPSEDVRKAMLLMVRVPGFRAYQASVDGSPAGAASMRIDGSIAQLCGAATLPRFRRRGVQTSLLRVRLADAAAAGCEVAVVTVQPASKSQQNAQRAGFSLLYSRALLVKEAGSGDRLPTVG
jgi:ribosomal protein S18 acetylase RimI-like enzyme